MGYLFAQLTCMLAPALPAVVAVFLGAVAALSPAARKRALGGLALGLTNLGWYVVMFLFALLSLR